MNKIKRLLRPIEKRIRFKWHRAPIATERIPAGAVVSLHRGFWGQLYAHPVQQPDKIFIGIALKCAAKDQPYPTWDVMPRGEISIPVSNFASPAQVTKDS